MLYWQLQKSKKGIDDMAEVLDREKQETAQTPAPSGFSDAPGAPLKKKKKNRKKTVRRIIALAVVAALAGGGFFTWKKLKGNGEDSDRQVLTDMVSRGSITSVVEGSGAAVAKNSAGVTLLANGQVRELYVSEGDYVTEGTPLFEIDSPEVMESITRAEENVRDQERALADRQAELAKFLSEPTEGDATAEYAGILIMSDDQMRKRVGDDAAKDEIFATLVDNTKLLLRLYFSYAYQNEIHVGQSAAVSIPATMAQLTGEVYEVHMVERISTEGGRFFEVIIALNNPGTLTEDMVATATIRAGGETAYPYESGKLSYFRSTEVKAPLTGRITAFNARNYQRVSAGESIAHVKMDDEGRAAELQSLSQRVEDAAKALEEAQKALDKATEDLNSLSAVAPIDGTVLSVGIEVGEEAKAGTVAVNIADTSTMIVNAMLDEMYISFAKSGMPVEISLWGETQLFGMIESVSLSATSENGVARFPMVISVDNSDGQLMSGAYVSYKFTASQSEDCLIVPIQCVKSVQTMDGENRKVLFVQSDFPPENVAELASEISDIPEGFYPVVVETGIADNYNIEILSGVEEFTTVYAGIMNTGNEGGMGFGMYF